MGCRGYIRGLTARNSFPARSPHGSVAARRDKAPAQARHRRRPILPGNRLGTWFGPFPNENTKPPNRAAPARAGQDRKVATPQTIHAGFPQQSAAANRFFTVLSQPKSARALGAL